jgi:hypothetical protein
MIFTRVNIDCMDAATLFIGIKAQFIVNKAQKKAFTFSK